MDNDTTKRPNLFQSFLPIIILMILLGINVFIYGDNSSYGPNQLALILAGFSAAIIGFTLKVNWKQMREGITKNITSTVPAIVILLLIGALAGTWLISGVVPAMVYYGMQILNPGIFLFAACIISAVVSLATGSSWSTIATVGVALLGIGQALDIYEGLVAGAIISGAYFGDKMSPLSDTTNLAPAMAGTDLFTHIRHMAWTTIPSIVITLIIFLVIGFQYNGSAHSTDMDEMLAIIRNKFHITPLLFIVPAVVIFMIIKKVPAIPSLLVGALLGGVFAIIFQSKAIEEVGSTTSIALNEEVTNQYNLDYALYTLTEQGSKTIEEKIDEVDGNLAPGEYKLVASNDSLGISGTSLFTIAEYGSKDFSMTSKLNLYKNDNIIKETEVSASRSSYFISSYKAFTNSITTGLSLKSGNKDIDDKLLTKGGMNGMLNTIWLILCAMIFGGIMDVTGLLARITDGIISLVKSRGGLIASTAGTCIFFNASASDQYLALVVPGKMFAKPFKDKGLKPENLSRTLEDSGTVTSVLVPWNTCGATQAGVLQVATLTYLPFCFFNILSPIITVIYGYIGFKVPMIGDDTDVPESNSLDDLDEDNKGNEINARV